MCPSRYPGICQLFKAPYRRLIPEHSNFLVSVLLALTGIITALGSWDVQQLPLIIFEKCAKDKVVHTKQALSQVK